MNTQLKIPHGDEKVTVELTRKELMSLAGIKFHDNHKVEVSARKKLHDILESQESAPSQLLN